MFWVIGKAPRVALVPLISLLEAHSPTFDEETAWQALIALENCLELDDDGNLVTDISPLVNLRPILQQIASLSINDPRDPRSARLAEIVQRILKRMPG